MALATATGPVRLVDDALAQMRFQLLQRPSSKTLTVVEIDAPSLQAAGTWPWGRERFAKVIENLTAAGAQVVALDIDFSARSTPEADAAFAAALGRHPGQVILPTFVQSAGRGAGRTDSRPLGALSDQVVLASVNVPVDADGRVRRYRRGFASNEGGRPSLASTLAGGRPGDTGAFLIDYGIRVDDIDHISFTDAYYGRFDPALVRGRNLLVGATALELGDEFATPRRGTLEGVYVHALAYESLRAGRALTEFTPLVTVTLASIAAFFLRPRGRRDYGLTLRRHLVTLALALGAPLAIQAWFPLSVNLGAVLLAQGLSLVWVVRIELRRRQREVVEQREAHLVQMAEHMRESRDTIRAAHDELQVVNAALDRALRARTDFLAMTSHEIRTPLNGIMGMTQVILAERRLDPGLRDKVRLVHASGENMLALVDDLLDVAKMESGALTISPVQMDLHRVFDDTASLWASKAQGKGLILEADRGAAPALIKADAGRIRQILFNLLANAIKFTERGRVKLTARVEVGADGEILALEVSDTGIGIPEDKHEQIFEAFAQVDDSTTRKYGGTGLGLAICHRLAHAMGGDLSVESSLGAGSSFTVRLPLVRARVASDPQIQDGSLSGASLLLVEANPLAQSVMKAALGGRVAALEIVASADDAFAALGTQTFDMLLVDGKALAPSAAEVAVTFAALEAAAGGAQAVLLWGGPAEDVADLERSGVSVVRRPIGSVELVQRLSALRASSQRPATTDAPNDQMRLRVL